MALRADLLDRVGARFATVEVVELAEASYEHAHGMLAGRRLRLQARPKSVVARADALAQEVAAATDGLDGLQRHTVDEAADDRPALGVILVEHPADEMAFDDPVDVAAWAHRGRLRGLDAEDGLDQRVGEMAEQAVGADVLERAAGDGGGHVRIAGQCLQGICPGEVPSPGRSACTPSSIPR